MYQVTIKGKNLDELKEAVSDINNELNSGTVLVRGIQKDMSIPVEVYKPLSVEEVKTIPTENILGETLIQPIVDKTVELVEKYNDAPIAQLINVAPGEADVEGIKWDIRIHTSKKTKTAKNVWKLKRGIDQNLVAQVKAEQLAATPVQTVAIPTEVPVIAQVQTIQPASPLIAPVAVVTPTPVAVVTPTPAIPTMNTGHSVETFTANFPMVIGTLITEGKVTAEYIESLKTYFGVAEIWNITDAQKAEVFEGFVTGNIIQKVG